MLCILGQHGHNENAQENYHGTYATSATHKGTSKKRWIIGYHNSDQSSMASLPSGHPIHARNISPV